MSDLVAFLRARLACSHCGRLGRRRRCRNAESCAGRRRLNEAIAAMPSPEEERERVRLARAARVAEIMRREGSWDDPEP